MLTRTHVPRVAWDAARTIANATTDPEVTAGLATWLTANADPSYGRLLVESRRRLSATSDLESVAVEAGVWRVRLADLLYDRPDLAAPMARLLHDPHASAA